MMAAWLAFLTAVAGIVALVLSYQLNPANQLRKELNDVEALIKFWEEARDKSLTNNDSNGITAAATELLSLHAKKSQILQRLASAGRGR